MSAWTTTSDGRVSPFGKPDDALGSSARYLLNRGKYHRGEHWGYEVRGGRVISALIYYKSTDMPRKALRNTTARSRNAPAKKSRQASADNPAPLQRPPPPGEGKRGEQGYLAYLLRQAQAATRLAMERALAELGVTSPQFVVLTMLRAYPGLSGADLARVAMLTPQTIRRHHPQSRARRRHQEDPAPRSWPGAAVDGDAARCSPARQMPAARANDRAAAGGRAVRQGPGHDPPLAGQNRRGSVRNRGFPRRHGFWRRPAAPLECAA